MSKKYRLKKEAVPFFKENLATSVYSLDVWEKYHVDTKALEEVKPLFITFGIPFKYGKFNSHTLGGWSQEDRTMFHFTIHFPSVQYCEHSKFSKGKTIRELMDKIQGELDSFYEDFVNDETLEKESNG